MRKVFLSGALALIGLAAPAASASAAPAKPGLYHVPIIGKVTLPGVVGSALGSGSGDGLRHATAVSSSNWAGCADTDDTFNSVWSSWTEPTVNCSNSGASLSSLLGSSSLLGGSGAASAFWVGLDGYNSTSVEQLGTDSYAWYEMYRTRP